MTKPNVYEVVSLMRTVADMIEAYHEQEPMKCSLEMANVVNHAQMLVECDNSSKREHMLFPRLKEAVEKWQRSLKGESN